MVMAPLKLEGLMNERPGVEDRMIVAFPVLYITYSKIGEPERISAGMNLYIHLSRDPIDMYYHVTSNQTAYPIYLHA